MAVGAQVASAPRLPRLAQRCEMAARAYNKLRRPGKVASAMATATDHLYIVRDESILSGEPIVSGTRTPVRAIVELWRIGVIPEEIPAHLPHLTLAQVFDGLSYYADHRSEIQTHIHRNQVPDDVTHPAARADA